MPKLIVLDMKTGRVLNSRLKQCMIEYAHDLCERAESDEDEITTTSTTNSEHSEVEAATFGDTLQISDENSASQVNAEVKSIDHESFSSDLDEKMYNLNNIDKVKNINFDLFNINLSFDTFDRVESKLFKEKSKAKTSQREKFLKESVLKELNENLIDLSTGRKYSAKPQTDRKQLHLLYFCSGSTQNEIYLDNVLKFLKLMQEKVNCSLQVVVISLDETQEEFDSLISRYAYGQKKKLVKRVEFENADPEPESTANSTPKRYVLDFQAKPIRVEISNELSVNESPFFSLIESPSGKIWSENLKLFILNSQLKDMVF